MHATIICKTPVSSTIKKINVSNRRTFNVQKETVKPCHAIMRYRWRKPEFLLMIPFTPKTTKYGCLMAAPPDGENYGQLLARPKQNNLRPMQIESRIDQDGNLKELIPWTSEVQRSFAAISLSNQRLIIILSPCTFRRNRAKCPNSVELSRYMETGGYGTEFGWGF